MSDHINWLLTMLVIMSQYMHSTQLMWGNTTQVHRHMADHMADQMALISVQQCNSCLMTKVNKINVEKEHRYILYISKTVLLYLNKFIHNCSSKS